jgi:hypothetical protein
MSKGKELDWTRTGTVEAMGEWVRSKSDAICVVVIRPDDAVLLVDPRCAPADAEMLVADRLPALADAVEQARREKRKGGRVQLEPWKE